MAKLSVQIAMYNTERYLGPCLRSVQAAIPDDTEIFIMDDCSSDRSPEIVKQFAAADPRIRYEKMPEQSGVAAARRRLVEMTDAEFCLPLDSDDYLLPGHLESHRNILMENPELLAVYGKSIVFFWQTEGRTVVQGNMFSPFGIHLYNPIKHGSIMYRRDAALAAGNYMKTSTGDGKREVAIDFSLWIRLGLLGPLLFDNQFTMMYRLHLKQLSVREDSQYTNALAFIDNAVLDHDRQLWDDLTHGRKLNVSSDKLLLLMQMFGIMVSHIDLKSPDRIKVCLAAESVAPGDPTIKLARLETLLAQENWGAADQLAEELPRMFANDPYIGMEIARLKLRYLPQPGTPSEVIAGVQDNYRQFKTAHHGNPDDTERLIAAMIMRFGGEDKL